MKIKTLLTILFLPVLAFAQDTLSIDSLSVTTLLPESIPTEGEEIKTMAEVAVFSILFYLITWISAKVKFLNNFIQDRNRFRFLLMTATTSIVAWALSYAGLVELLQGVLGAFTFYKVGVEGVVERFPQMAVLKTPKAIKAEQKAVCKECVCSRSNGAKQDSL